MPMDISYDDLGAIDLTGLIKTATDTYGTIKGAKDAKSIAAANARAAQAAAAAEEARTRAIIAGQAPRTDWGKIGLYAGLAVVAGTVIIGGRRALRRRR